MRRVGEHTGSRQFLLAHGSASALPPGLLTPSDPADTLACMIRESPARGFTLIELLVVLLLLGLAAALAAPALRTRKPGRTGLESLVSTARGTAVRRGETLYLQIAASGEWRLEGGASPPVKPLASGRLAPFTGLPLTLLLSPVGTCAFDARSGAAARTIQLDPLTCDIADP